MADNYSAAPNIYIVGAQCTGKTTLVNALEDHFAVAANRSRNGSPVPVPVFVKEVARGVLKQHKFTANDITSSKERAFALQRLILRAQVSAETSAETSEPAGWLISDRSGVDPIVYAIRYVGDQPAQELLQSKDWQQLKERMSRALVVICEPDLRWLSNDGVRLMPADADDWLRLHASFSGVLEEAAIQYKVLPASVSTVQDRVNFVLGYWGNLN